VSTVSSPTTHSSFGILINEPGPLLALAAIGTPG